MESKVDRSPDAGASEPGVLVVGHGTRDAAGIAEFYEVVRQLATRLAPRPVEAGFLELAEPTIAAAVDRLAARGVRRFTVAPVVLFAAGHAKRDIPDAVAAAAARHDNLVWHQAAPLGLHPRMVELSNLRYREATAGLPQTNDAAVWRIVVGRGSSDPSAVAETGEFSRLCAAAAAGAGCTQTAFVALADPRLDEVLQRAAASTNVHRVVVQPHLLFVGEMLQQVKRCIDAARTMTPRIQWLLAGHLGPHRDTVEAVLARLSEVWAETEFENKS